MHKTRIYFICKRDV